MIRPVAVVALLACIAAALPGAESVRVIRGPWWWHAADGSAHVGVAVAGPAQAPPLATLDGREIPARGVLVPLAGSADEATGVLILHLAAGLAGTLRFDVAGQPVQAHLHPAIADDAAARIALAGGHAWPDRQALDALGKALGGAPQLVLALGPGVPARLGTGGWEADIPIAIVAPEDPALAASTGGDDAAWRHGLHLGVLGMPASPERDRADLALARDLSPWLVYLDVPAGWDPAIGVHPPSEPRSLAILIAACQRLKVPLALGAGSAGLVSEPLTLSAAGDTAVAAHAADGVRYVLPIPAVDDGLSRLPLEVSLPLEQPVLCGLAASLAELRLETVVPGQADSVRLAWRRNDDAAPANAGELARTVAAAESLATPAIRQAMERWLWMTRGELAGALPPVALIARLREEGGLLGRALARRLALFAAEDPATPAIPGEPDPLVARDRLLLKLATVRGSDAASWRNLAAATSDPLVLRAILGDLARDPERTVLPALVARVGLQADGTLAIDPDPIDQHRLYAAVFDDVRLSPTPLRPWAVILREKVAPLARGPIDRFLKRHGELRPVP